MERPASQNSLTRVLEAALAAGRRVAVQPVVSLFPRWVTPNRLSLLRLVLAGVVAVLLWTGRPWSAFGVYAGALLTDALDGEIARRRQLITRFGTRLDPSTDKVLHGVLFLSFWNEAPVLFALLLLLDLSLFLVGLALLFLPRLGQQDLSASVFGRWKMVFQALGCLGIFWNTAAPSVAIPRPVVLSLLTFALGFAVLSMAGYLPRLFGTRRAPILK